ncbi:TonB-dependent receptor plug domain-containing protein [Parasphingorhabdus sp.]|uniref:TonB-dependent receptor plug domain-containing protein n=1 Tax=Parasphingorhabdus sp. TaxID=2709688 RepID=UPI003D269714
MNHRMTVLHGIALGALIAGLPCTAIAQSQSPVAGDLQPRLENGRQIYVVAQFERFNPRTALDIVNQIPGFIIDTGDDDQRGLGQADENVLINGARISGKNNDAFTTLRRISVENILRLEIVDGATLSISGLSGQVLNVVTNDDGERGVTGNFRWRPQIRRAGENWFAGDISISGPLGKGEFTLALENDAFRNGAQGRERVIGRNFIRDEVARTRGDRPVLNASFTQTSDAGSIFNINAEYGLNNFRQQVTTARTEPGRSDISEIFVGTEDEWNAELSADYEFDLGGGRLKLIGLQRLEHSPFEDMFEQRFTDGVTPLRGNQFNRTIDEGESVARAEYSWKTDGGTDWGINVEGAYNFLESEGALLVRDAQGVFQPITLTNANSKVTEYRGEIIGTYGRALSDNLTLQATLGGEYSQISQNGPLGQTRSFIRPKGSISLAWKPQDDLDFSFKLERKVDQLNFFDFVASVDVSNDVRNAGNPALVPPQSWNAEIEGTFNLGAFGSTTVKGYYNKISDIVDAIPITDTTEALGNLDSAKQYGITVASTFLLDPLGWTGAKIDVEAEAQRSSVLDPLTGVKRRISDDLIYNYEVSFRHDIPNSNLAYGGGLERYDGFTQIRLDQTADFDELQPYAWIFIEHKDVFGLTVNANLGNLFNRTDRFVRTDYVGRRDGPINFIEDRSRKFGLIYRLTVSGSF